MATRSRIRVFIVDDETPARDAIRLRLQGETDIEIVGEAANGPDAVRLITALRPDLLFIDVQMRGMNGFEVIERVAETHLPIVVFVTAYDQYALRAFEAHALDFLLKPFTSSRFDAALNRARREVARASDEDSQIRLLSLLTERLRLRESATTATPEAQTYLSRLTVKHNSRIALINTSEIDWIESSANYAHVHVNGKTTFVVRMTMTELERQLDPSLFVRVHRSVIVQIDRIKEIAPLWHGDAQLTLADGKTFRLTRNYRARLLAPRAKVAGG